MARGTRSQQRLARPGAVTIRDRVRRLPNSLMLYVTFALAIGAAIVATFPYDVVATAPLPPNEIDVLATSTTASTTTTTIAEASLGSLPGTTSTTIRTGLETQPRAVGSALECGPPLFELAVPGKDRRVAANDDCLEGARWRVTLAGAGGGVAFLTGMVARRIRLKNYERIAKEERRRLLRRRAAEADAASRADAAGTSPTNGP